MDDFTWVTAKILEIIALYSEHFGGNKMKKYSILVLALVLTAALLTACGCRNSKPMNTVPTTVPTTEATKPTTQPTTAPTTSPTMAPETTENNNATIDNGNGPLPTNDNSDLSRGRRMPSGR